jgi:hypothetical protein
VSPPTSVKPKVSSAPAEPIRRSAEPPVVEHLKATTIPYTLLYTSHPYTDILAWDLLAPAPCGHGLVLGIPAPDDCQIPGYALEQIGDWVKVALKKPKKWIGAFFRHLVRE